MNSPQLPGVFAHLAPALDHLGYLAVGGLVVLEDFGVPVPGRDDSDRRRVLVVAAVVRHFVRRE